jgi:hypothetical protein
MPIQTRDLLGKDGLANNVPNFIAHGSDERFSQEFQRAIGMHCLAILHSPAYRDENKGAMRADEPRVPFLPNSDLFQSSCELGRQVSALLNPNTKVAGVNDGKLRRFLREVGVPQKIGGEALDTTDLRLTAGWGHVQRSKAGSALVMPGGGLVNERDYTSAELSALSAEANALDMSAEVALAILGRRTLDIHLNAQTMWTNIPASVWDYTLGGYQVTKKWLSYREAAILGRPLKPDEVGYVSEMVRRIAAILLQGPTLDANYEAAKANAVEWKEGRPVLS